MPPELLMAVSGLGIIGPTASRQVEHLDPQPIVGPRLFDQLDLGSEQIGEFRTVPISPIEIQMGVPPGMLHHARNQMEHMGFGTLPEIQTHVLKRFHELSGPQAFFRYPRPARTLI